MTSCRIGHSINPSRAPTATAAPPASCRTPDRSTTRSRRAQPASQQGVETHQILLALSGAAQHVGTRRRIIAEAANAATRSGEYRDSRGSDDAGGRPRHAAATARHPGVVGWISEMHSPLRDLPAQTGWGGWGSNPRPRDYESPALTTELPPRMSAESGPGHGNSPLGAGRNGCPGGLSLVAPRAGLEPATR